MWVRVFLVVSLENSIPIAASRESAVDQRERGHFGTELGAVKENHTAWM